MRWLVLIALGACYSPSKEQPCTITCAISTDCPSSLACNGEVCTLPNGMCGDEPDAGVVLPDGVAPLPPGCAGMPGGLMPNACFNPPPGVVDLAGPFDTGDDPRCLSSELTHCIVIGEAITVRDLLVVIGTRVLVLWSGSTIEVSAAGTIDVASRLGGKRGPGTNPGSCTGGAGNTISEGSITVGSGGGGGSYAVDGGGRGGRGRTANELIDADGVQPTELQPSLRGGCDGADGGISPGSSGPGGGAVYLMANALILVNGIINASGAAGLGGAVGIETYGGGGGGGSGGLIAFDAPFVQLKGANVIAIGGCGGSGSALDGVDRAGNPGRDAVANPFDDGEPGTQTILANSGGAASQMTMIGGMGGDVASSLVGGGGGAGGGPGHVAWFGTLKDVIGSTIAPPLLPP